eukprot:1577546-Ditylum_brightwellii.AAC.1
MASVAVLAAVAMAMTSLADCCMAESNNGQDGVLIILSYVHLDNSAVMRNLDLLSQGFAAMENDI